MSFAGNSEIQAGAWDVCFISWVFPSVVNNGCIICINLVKIALVV